MSHPRVSIVIPTYGRPLLLARCLLALTDQAFPKEEYEILVADDAHELAGWERTLELVGRIHKESGVAIRYVGVTGRHGPSAARNQGWRQARSRIIAFTDDDTIPDRLWLANGVRAFAREDRELHGFDGRVLAVTGKTLVPIPDMPTDYELNESGLGRAEFITANCFVLREVLVAVGGFDEAFTMAWREDSDLQFRLMQLGGGEACIRRVDDAIVVHPVRPASFAISLKQARKALFNALLYKKHPDLYRQRIQARPPLHYYAMVLCLLIAVVSAVIGDHLFASSHLLIWMGLVLRFASDRLRGTSKDPAHVAEMLLTSALLAPVAVFWRLYGAWKFRVAFA